MAMSWPGPYGFGYYRPGWSPALDVANEAGANARRAQTHIMELGRDVDRLSMISQALWLILKEQHGFDDETLRKKVMQIDLKVRHDAKDGAAGPAPCPGCGRPLSRRHAHCIYCGAERKHDVFDR
jgi:hypothetical protein